MTCNKNKKRDLNNIFEIFTCSKCFNDYKYDYIYIGNNTINIYELNNECINDIKQLKMIKLFLKEKILNTDDLYLILDNIEYNKIFDYLPLLIDNQYKNIYILIVKKIYQNS